MYRSVFEKFKGRPEDGWAWLWILSRTRYEADGQLKRGEVYISTRRLADVMGWTRPKAQRFIKRLLKGGEIRSSNRSPNRSPHGRVFSVVRYRELQPSRKRSDPPTDPPTDPLVRKKKGRRLNGAAETPESEGGSTALRREIEKGGGQ